MEYELGQKIDVLLESIEKLNTTLEVQYAAGENPEFAKIYKEMLMEKYPEIAKTKGGK